MKKNLSRVLALALVLASLLSLTAGAFADGTKVVIPNKFSRLESQLPEREAQPTVRTKTEKGEIMVRVAGDPDNVYANWLGYGEEKEEVNLDNGLGYVELEGHKYQLGAKWNNKQYRSYFAFDPDLEEWVPVEYKGTVKVGNREMKLIEDMRKPIVDILEDKAWAWVYDYKNTDTVEAEDEVSDPVKPTSYADGLLIARAQQCPGKGLGHIPAVGDQLVLDVFFDIIVRIYAQQRRVVQIVAPAAQLIVVGLVLGAELLCVLCSFFGAGGPRVSERVLVRARCPCADPAAKKSTYERSCDHRRNDDLPFD